MYLFMIFCFFVGTRFSTNHNIIHISYKLFPEYVTGFLTTISCFKVHGFLKVLTDSPHLSNLSICNVNHRTTGAVENVKIFQKPMNHFNYTRNFYLL